MKVQAHKTKWQSLPEAAVRELQIRRFREYLRRVVLPFSANYREISRREGWSVDSFRTLDDLDRIPFTSKEDLVNTPEQPERARDFLIVPDESELKRRPGTIMNALLRGPKRARAAIEREYRPIFLTSTTGRSSDPVPFLFTQHDLDNLEVTGRRLFEVCGAQKDFRLLNMFPYAPHLAFWQAHYGATAFGVFMVSSGGGKVLGTEGQLRLMRKIKPNVLIGMPTFVYHVLLQAVDEGLECPQLCRIVLGGEKVALGTRRKLRELARKLGAAKIDIVGTYGFTEAKMAWAECAFGEGQDSPGYHLYPDLGIIEVIDPKTGHALPPGEPGEIVFTPLDARGSVVLRYRTGDLIDGGLVYERCPCCGRSCPRLVGRISRSSEIRSLQLDKVKGTLVDFNQLEHVLDDAEHIGGWQLELRKRNDDPLEMDELVLHVHRTDSVNEEALKTELARRFAGQTEVQPNEIVFHDAEEIKRLLGVGRELKERRIVDRRPQSSAGSQSHISNAEDNINGRARDDVATPVEAS